MMKLDLQMFGASGTILGSTSSSLWTFKLEVREGDYNILNNTSPVTVEAFIGRIQQSSYMTGAEISCPVTITGVGTQTISGRYTTGTIPAGGWYSLGSTTFTVPHETDGSKTISISASFTNDVSPSSGSASGSLILTKIPRNSTLKDVPVYVDESAGVKVTIDKNVTSYYDVITISYGSTILGTYNNVKNGDTLKISNLTTLYNLTSNVAEPKLTYTLKTYTNSQKTTQIGSSSVKTGKFKFVNQYPIWNGVPTYQDTNSTTVNVTGSNQVIIKNYSNVQITISSAIKPTAKKGASIVKYIFPDGGSVNYSTSNVTYTIKQYNGTQSIAIQAIDSRGFGKIVYLSISKLINYNQLPQITNVTTERKNGVESETYLGLNLKLWIGDFNSNRNNAITYFGYRVKLASESWGNQTWYDKTSAFKTAVSGQSLDNISLPISSQFKIHANGSSGGMTEGNAYNIQIKVSDGYGSAKFNTDIETGYVQDGKVLDSYYKSSTGYKYAVNGMVDTSLDDGLQVEGSLYLNGTKLTQGTTNYNSLSNKPSINGVTLSGNKTSANLKIPSMTILYNNSNGTTGNVSLSDNPTKYKYIEIIHGIGSTNNLSTGKVLPTKWIFMGTMAQVADSGSHYLQNKVEQVGTGEKTINRGEVYISNVNVANSNVSSYVSSTNRDYIFTVIGYN